MVSRRPGWRLLHRFGLPGSFVARADIFTGRTMAWRISERSFRSTRNPAPAAASRVVDTIARVGCARSQPSRHHLQLLIGRAMTGRQAAEQRLRITRIAVVGLSCSAAIVPAARCQTPVDISHVDGGAVSAPLRRAVGDDAGVRSVCGC